LRPGPPAKQKGRAGAGMAFAVRPIFSTHRAKDMTDNAVPIESIVIRRRIAGYLQDIFPSIIIPQSSNKRGDYRNYEQVLSEIMRYLENKLILATIAGGL
jgi:hypothetical protein